ncbi:hypothetical protein K402DRAFT_425409 [Aulographum hederae CBS 113979]|uniref:ATP synthase F(0) complex subunit e, mitochondrial n=1 Tax=Aulographum hederae CBS 113979 TaxID=1176131 RepID=A0A6G1GKW1_9PEZI|nr:hypothetical protein K402DRAFT_425409 [Aulographum hederae CBS 113979]
MASMGVNVLRWSALGVGLFYGITHQAAISSKDKLAAKNAAYDHQAKLVSDAKAEWARKHAPPSGVITNPDDPKFDLEALVKSFESTA